MPDPPARGEGRRRNCRWRTSCAGVGMSGACGRAMWDDDAIAVYERQAQLVRDAGALAELPIHLQALALERAWRGDLPGARRLDRGGREHLDVDREPGPAVCAAAGSWPCRGAKPRPHALIEPSSEQATARGQRNVVKVAHGPPRCSTTASDATRRRLRRPERSSRTASFPGCRCGRGSNSSRRPCASATRSSRAMRSTRSRRRRSLRQRRRARHRGALTGAASRWRRGRGRRIARRSSG